MRMKTWHKLCCSSCDNEFYYSRTVPKDIDLIKGDEECSECSSYRKTWNEGFEAGKKAAIDELSKSETFNAGYQKGIKDAKGILNKLIREGIEELGIEVPESKNTEEKS